MRKKRNPTRMVMDALLVVRRAQLEVRRAKARARQLEGVLPAGEYRNLILSLETIDNVLERVAVRLETILASGIITADLLRLPRVLVSKASSQLANIPPELSQSLAEINDILDAIIAQAPEGAPEIPIAEENVEESAEEVLEEAKKEAVRRLEESPA
ncbi:MAG: hypothetical protein F7C33_01435 [Desulfurococcales archaeon]|nr:hypothetical protein [Desulfurococcales archaeon]